jgi:hypothetical protein
MKRHLVVIAACAAAAAATAQAGPFDQFRGKMKAGNYEYKMQMDMGEMPGLPPGMGKQNMTFQHCVTQEDIDKGALGRGRDGKAPENCEIKNMSVSGNTATYSMECKAQDRRPAMKADNRITFRSDGYDMDMKMAMDQGGRMMNMTQHFEGRYLGPCNK